MAGAAEPALLVSLLEPAVRTGCDLEGFVSGLPAAGADAWSVRLTLHETCKRSSRSDIAHRHRASAWMVLCHLDERRPLAAGPGDGAAFFSFRLPARGALGQLAPPSFRARQNGAYLSCAYRLAVLDAAGVERAECAVHVVNDASPSTSAPAELCCTRSMWLRPRLR